MSPWLAGASGSPRLALPVAAIILLNLFLSPGCATSGAPRYGTITFHDPAPPAGSVRMKKRRRPRPVTISYRSNPEASESSTALRSLVRSGVGDGSELDESVKRELMSGPRTVTRKVGTLLLEDEFQGLWSALEETGIFGLPEHPYRAPPKNRAYFLFDNTETQWIFLRPDLSPSSALTEDDVKDIEAWRKAKQVMVIATGRWQRPRPVSPSSVLE